MNFSKASEWGKVSESLFGKTSRWNSLPVLKLRCRKLCNVHYRRCTRGKTAISLFFFFFLNTGVYGYHVNLTRSFFTDLFTSVSTDPAPVLEASHTLEGRLQQLQSSAPDGEALVREISGYWKKHLECLEKTGQHRIVYIREQSHLNGKSWPLLYRCWEVDLNVPVEKTKKILASRCLSCEN